MSLKTIYKYVLYNNFFLFNNKTKTIFQGIRFQLFLNYKFILYDI